MHWLRPNPGWLKNTLNHVYNAVITMIVTAAVQLGIWRLVDPGTLRNVGIIAVGIAGVVGFFALAVTRTFVGSKSAAPQPTTATSDASRKAEIEEVWRIIREAINISVTGADLSGLWLLDPYLEIELNIENGIGLVGFITEIEGNISIGTIRCNLRPEFKDSVSSSAHISSSDGQRLRLIQPATSDMANALRNNLVSPGASVTLDFWRVHFTIKGIVGRWPVQCLTGLSDEDIRIQGPIPDAATARNLVRLPLTLAHYQPAADTADSPTR